MGDARVTQIAAQVLVLVTPPIRVTQIALQALVHRCQADHGISAAMLAHMLQSCTNLCTLWKVTALDSTAVRYSDHTRKLTYDGQEYKPAAIQPTTFKASNDLSTDNQDIVSPITSDGFTESDLLGGKWDFARVEINVVNYLDLTMGPAKRLVGKIGEVSLRNGRFTAEFRGITQLLDQEIGDLTAPLCRAELGDAACGVDLGPFTFTAEVDSVIEAQSIFTVDTVQADGYFRYGKATFTTGANTGLSMEVKDSVGARITLMLPIRNNIAIGDDVTLVRGCDHTRATCRDVFGNVLRIRAEPDLPGRERVLKFPRRPTQDIPETE